MMMLKSIWMTVKKAMKVISYQTSRTRRRKMRTRAPLKSLPSMSSIRMLSDLKSTWSRLMRRIWGRPFSICTMGGDWPSWLQPRSQRIWTIRLKGLNMHSSLLVSTKAKRRLRMTVKQPSYSAIYKSSKKGLRVVIVIQRSRTEKVMVRLRRWRTLSMLTIPTTKT